MPRFSPLHSSNQLQLLLVFFEDSLFLSHVTLIGKLQRMVEEDVVRAPKIVLPVPTLLLQLSVTMVHLCAYAREGARLFMFTLYVTYLGMHGSIGSPLV